MDTEVRLPIFEREIMKAEIENALKNVDLICANARLSRNEHAELARNIKLIHDELVAAEINQKPLKKGSENGKQLKTDV